LARPLNVSGDAQGLLGTTVPVPEARLHVTLAMPVLGDPGSIAVNCAVTVAAVKTCPATGTEMVTRGEVTSGALTVKATDFVVLLPAPSPAVTASEYPPLARLLNVTGDAHAALEMTAPAVVVSLHWVLAMPELGVPGSVAVNIAVTEFVVNV
jgi:hypothetical protein